MVCASIFVAMGSKLLKRSLVALGLCVAGPVFAAAPPEPVDIELVIATDVSPSIDRMEAKLQRDGIVAAFENPQVIDAIQSGSLGKIGVVAIDFSAREYTKIITNWMVIKDKTSALQFAEIMRKTPTSTGRHTSISDAIETAEALLEENQLEGTKKVIDISGDGPNNWGRPVNVVRDEAVAKGITINGLPILGSSADLDKYYMNCVIGGPASFIVVANGFSDFARAIRNKLIQEIAMARPAPRDGLAIRIANTPAPSPRPRGGFNAPLNEKGCENQFGGFDFRGFDFPIPVQPNR
jgi:sulfur transfer complex TusBCD TusB component (DsrH family)